MQPLRPDPCFPSFEPLSDRNRVIDASNLRRYRPGPVSTHTPRSQVRLGTFHAACWMLALIAFVELVAVGVALALRNSASKEPIVVERIVKEYVSLDLTPVATVNSPPALADPPVERLSPLPKAFTNEDQLMKIPTADPTGSPTLKTPFINDPIVERLVREARQERVKDNIGAAIVKLEEAQQTAPDEPNVLYQFAEIFGAVGHYEKAADYYEKVFALGPQKAGSLYELSAHKLAVGFEHAQKMEGKLTLGRIRHFNDNRVTEGEKVILTIPVLAAPNQEIDPSKLVLNVLFFDKRNGKIHQATSDSKMLDKWITEPLNWKDSGEELLQFTYIIPSEDDRNVHLLGEREYFGQVVELLYDNELLDHQAWPRTLALHRNVPEANPLFIPEEFMPEELNEANPLLPPLPR